MTDSDPKLPDPAGDATPSAPPGPADAAAPQDGGAPEAGGNPPASGPADGAAGTPGMEATTQMPVTDTDPAAADGVPPVGPDQTGLDGDDEVPWYKKPAGIAAIVAVALVVLGVIGWLIFGGGDDDDDATTTSSRLILEATDNAGDLIDTGFIADVTGPADAPTSFVWLRPADGPSGEPAGDSTGTDGRVDFEWEADETVDDPTAWVSTVEVVANVPPGWTPPSPVVECVLQPLDGQQSVVSMAVELNSPDPTIDRFATLTFPNYQFTPGDTVTCQLVATAPAPTTVVDTTVVETTVVDTTVVETTVVETTVPETTVATTTVPETTVAPTTTVPVVTVPPQPGATLWDIIDNSPDLSALKALIEVADPAVREALENPDATITLFAPSNTAIENAANIVPPPDLTDPAVVTPILLAHVDDTEPVLLLADVLALPSVPVVQGGPQPVDAAAQTIGGASVLVPDVTAANGVIHVIDAVLQIQP